MGRTCWTSATWGAALILLAAGVAACGGSEHTRAPVSNRVEGAPPPASARMTSIVSWGNNRYRELGMGLECTGQGELSNNCTRPTPVPVVSAGGSGNLTNVRALGAGGFHTLALLRDGSLLSWGYNLQGQLGTGAYDEGSAKPVPVVGPDGRGRLRSITAVSGGGEHSLAIDKHGAVWAWGDNIFGELGVGTSTGPAICALPAATAPERPPSAPALQGGGGPCGLVPRPVVGPAGTGQLSGIASVSGGANHSVALARDGTVWAWGENDRGQLGSGDITGPEMCKPFPSKDAFPCSTRPVQVIGPDRKGHLDKVKAIAAGEDVTLALRTDGTVWAWGTNQFDALGQKDDDSKLQPCYAPLFGQAVPCSPVPIQVVGPNGLGFLDDVTAVAAQGLGDHVAALRSDGTVWDWGVDDAGQLGIGGVKTSIGFPVQVAGPEGEGVLTGVASVDVGTKFTVALKSDGSVWTWGINWRGELGIHIEDGPEKCTGENLPCSLFPVQVHGINDAGLLAGVATIAVRDSGVSAGLR